MNILGEDLYYLFLFDGFKELFFLELLKGKILIFIKLLKEYFEVVVVQKLVLKDEKILNEFKKVDKLQEQLIVFVKSFVEKKIVVLLLEKIKFIFEEKDLSEKVGNLCVDLEVL